MLIEDYHAVHIIALKRRTAKNRIYFIKLCRNRTSATARNCSGIWPE